MEEKYTNNTCSFFFQFKTLIHTEKDFKKQNCFIGFVGGSQYTHTGAAVEPLCLPRKPEWGNYYRDGTD